MNDLEYQQMMEESWRRDLSPIEEARMRSFLAEHPQMQADWEQEAALNRLLADLPDAPVSTNFTSRVLQAVQREEAKRVSWTERLRSLINLGHGWLPRVAVAGVVLSVGLFSVHEHQLSNRTRQMAQQAAQFGKIATVSKIDWLKDFETIDRMSKVQVADTELLALLE